MTDLQKKEIQQLLNEHVGQYDSQAKAAAALKNVSEGVVINIRKGNWDSISDSMWTNVGKQVGFSAKGAWSLVKSTNDFKTLMSLFDDAKEYSNVYAIIAPPGSGKTAAAAYYEKEHKNVYHLVCAEYFNRKIFLSRLLGKIGKDTSGNTAELMDSIIETLLKQKEPVIILDEADKLPDPVLYFFITLYNMLEGRCAIVLLATDFLSKRINKGRRLNKKGYNEIFSRLGRKFITLPGTNIDEVTAICKANGVTDQKTISYIYNEYEGDLRRVERAVHRSKKIKK